MISLQVKERCIAETKVEGKIQIIEPPQDTTQYNKAHVDANCKLCLVFQLTNM